MPPTFKWFNLPNRSAFDIWLQECWERAVERDLGEVDLDNGPGYTKIQDSWLDGGEFHILTAKDSLNFTIAFRVFRSERVYCTKLKICEGQMSNPSFKSIVIRIDNEFQRIRDIMNLLPVHPPNSEEQQPKEHQEQCADTPKTTAAEEPPLPPDPASDSRIELGISQCADTPKTTATEEPPLPPDPATDSRIELEISQCALPPQPEIDLNC